MFNRVLIKLSGEALSKDNSFDNDVIKRIADEIKEIKEQGTEITLVVGGGNFWRGRSANEHMDRTKADEIGMLATIMNAIYLADFFRTQDIKAIVMTPFVVGSMTVLYNRDKANDYIKNGYIIIFAGGLGHPFFSTDTIASLRAAELSCDCILYAKNIDGIYDSDPKLNPNAIKYNEITYKEIIEKNLKAIDISAMNLCNEQKIMSIAFSLLADRSIVIASKNNDEIFEFGTRVIFT